MKALIFIVAITAAIVITITGCASGSAVVADEQQIKQPQIDDVAEQEGAPSLQPAATQGPRFTLAPPIQSIEPEDSSLYSSYAHMRSFDPATGIAQFDYFDILIGDDAVDWLINCEGYCSVDAQDEVNDYADSEYIEKNTNPQLREIDLTIVPLKLMYTPSGKLLIQPDGEPADFADVLELWQVNQSYVLYTHFYYITVDEDTEQVLLVEQVYWP